MTQRATFSTMVLDTTTMAHALTALSQAYGSDWWAQDGNMMQQLFFAWYERHAGEVEKLQNLKGMISGSAEVLNQFLVENGFEPLFREFGGLGAASILDMFVEWAVAAKRTTVTSYETGQGYSAFSVPTQGAEFFALPPGIGDGRLVRLRTKDGSSVWVMMANRPQHELDMVRIAMTAMSSRERIQNTSLVSGVVIPTLEINAQPSLDWMVGASCAANKIGQAFQQFRLRMNEEGARIKVATGISTRGGGPIAEPIIFNRPFIGWFTQSGSDLPIGAFYADFDSWKTPEGSLAEL